jgi:hypothetical protein
MTFEQFQATQQRCEDLAAALRDEVFEREAKGLIYIGCLYIEDTTDWPKDAPGHGKGRWYLRMASTEYQTDDLEELERRLYAYAGVEGFCD